MLPERYCISGVDPIGAYLDATDDMLEVIVKVQFLDAVQDQDLRLQIRQNRPTFLSEALEQALELESYQLGNR